VASAPAAWTEHYDDGRIVVWGAPGCGGAFSLIHGPFPAPKIGGMGGPGGGGGGTGRLCYSPPFDNYYTHQGKEGALGDPGAVGAMGDAGMVQIVGPAHLK
jgi:hypothetical protein